MNALNARLPIIVALLVAAILSVLVAGIAVRFIEQRSYSDVTSVLKLSGYDWADVSVDGLTVELTGTAPNEAARFRALTAASSVVDSARVRDAMQVAESTIAAPRFSIEILRNENDISLIGLVPKSMDLEAFLTDIDSAISGAEVADLLDSADHPQPAGWGTAVEFGMVALKALPRSKISIAADRVTVNGISDSERDKQRLELELTRSIPKNLRVALEITAPRPAITPFTLRFLIDAEGNARFDACSADTEKARDRVLQAAVAAGFTGKATCTIGLGAPSPRWGEAGALAIAAVKELGGGSVTFSDADVSLVALDSTPRDLFDSVVGGLEKDLPDAFSLFADLPEPVNVDGTGDGANAGPPEFVATRSPEGQVQLRGRLSNEREQAVIDGFAKAIFGAVNVRNVTRLDETLPDGWSVRVLVALEALGHLNSGSAVVQPEFAQVKGITGNPDANAEVSRLLSDKLGDAANFSISIDYEKKLDPVLGLPTPEECAAEINASLSAQKINFAPGSADIDIDANPTLDAIAMIMKNCSDVPMEIGGHTDSQGREEMNQSLSQSRATAVLNALLARRVLTSNLTAVGFGESNPIADNGTEEGREANRRIEFRLILSDEGSATDTETEAGTTDEQN